MYPRTHSDRWASSSGDVVGGQRIEEDGKRRIVYKLARCGEYAPTGCRNIGAASIDHSGCKAMEGDGLDTLDDPPRAHPSGRPGTIGALATRCVRKPCASLVEGRALARERHLRGTYEGGIAIGIGFRASWGRGCVWGSSWKQGLAVIV